MSRRFTILIATLLLVFLQNPAWASYAPASIEDIIFFVVILVVGLMIVNLPGAVVGAYMAFSPGRYWKCLLGAFAGGLPVTIAICHFYFFSSPHEFILLLAMDLLVAPVIALVVGLPTSVIIHPIRSRSNKNKQQLADDQNPEQVAEGNDGD